MKVKDENKDEKVVTELSTLCLLPDGKLILTTQPFAEQHLSPNNDPEAAQAGATVEVVEVGDVRLLVPHSKQFNALSASIANVLEANKLTATMFLDTLEETRRELFAEVYQDAAKNNRDHAHD